MLLSNFPVYGFCTDLEMLTVIYLLPNLPTAFKIQCILCVHHVSLTLFAFLFMLGSGDDFQLPVPSV